jgi:hypothetical protein
MSFTLNDYIELAVDSRNRTSGSTATDFTVTLPGSLRIINAQLISAEIPLTYYNITSRNNTLGFSENGGAATAITPLTPGSYNIYELATLLASALTTASPNVQTYAVDVNDNTFKVNVNIPAPAVASFEMFFNPLSVGYVAANVGDVFGFTTETDQTGATQYTAPSVYNAGGETHFVLKCDQLIQTGGQHGVWFATPAPDDMSVLAVIPITSGPNTVLFYEDNRQIFFRTITPVTTALTFRLTFSANGVGGTVNLNGAEVLYKLGLFII